MTIKHGRISEDASEAERIAIVEKNKTRGDMLVEHWAKSEIGAGLPELYQENAHKARCTASAIHMQESYLTSLSESIISTSFQMKPENLLKVVRIGVANSKRGDFATEYPLQSVDDAFYFVDATYEQTLRGATAGDKIYENINMYYTGEEVTDTINATGAGTAYAVTVSTPKPMVAYTVKILVGGAIIANDDGSGNITGTGLDTSLTNTVNYTTGLITLNFSLAPGAAITTLYNWNSEDSTLFDQFGTVGISLRKIRFQARPQPLGYSVSTMTQITLETTGLGDAEAMLIGTVGDEHAKVRDYKAIARMRMVALGNGTNYFDTNFAAAGEIGSVVHAQNLMGKIMEIGGTAVYDVLKRGQINKAIAGSKALVYMMKHEDWKTDTTDARVGVYFAGKFGDIDVYACPADTALVNNDEILLTFKNPQEGADVSMVFGVLTEIHAALQYPEFYTRGNIASIEDAQTINSSFVRLLKLQNL